MTNIPKSERRNFVGASEVAALFGLHPQITKFELWHRKKGNIDEPDLSDVERIFWGQTLEPAIAKGIAAQQGWKIRRVRRYVVSPYVPGMGASLDYEILKHPAGVGALEIKNVDGLIYRDWPEDEPPMHFLLQLQHQLACIPARKWGAIGALIGGNTPKIFKMDRHEGTIAKIEKAVERFWQSIADNKPPSPDFEADGAAIALLCRDITPGKSVVCDDSYFEELCERYCAARAAEKDAKTAKDAAKAEMLTLMDSAEKIYSGAYYINRAKGFHLYERKEERETPEAAPPPIKVAGIPKRSAPVPLTERDSIF
jgi:putative phage-type endonuclease